MPIPLFTARRFPVPLMFAAILAGLNAPASAQTALSGLDSVGMRDSERAIPGQPGISTRWKGSEWVFANEANRATFEANPRAYAPGFGGNCPVALADGEKRQGQPRYFVVIDGTIYLPSSPAARSTLTADPHGILSRAAAQWKRLGR